MAAPLLADISCFRFALASQGARACWPMFCNFLALWLPVLSCLLTISLLEFMAVALVCELASLRVCVFVCAWPPPSSVCLDQPGAREWRRCCCCCYFCLCLCLCRLSGKSAVPTGQRRSPFIGGLGSGRECACARPPRRLAESLGGFAWLHGGARGGVKSAQSHRANQMG